MNTFGGPSKVSLKTSVELSRYEHENEDGVLVFLADTWLDSIKVCRFLIINPTRCINFSNLFLE